MAELPSQQIGRYNVRTLAGSIACASTSNSMNEEDYVAKNGEESVFSVLQKLLPEVIHMITSLNVINVLLCAIVCEPR